MSRARRAIAVAALVSALAWAPAAGAGGRRHPRGSEPAGDVRDVHDPCVARDGRTWYVFSTRAGISVRCSNDLVRWRYCGDVFGHLPQWAVQDVPGLRGLWASSPIFANDMAAVSWQ